jgi:acetyl-CoA carboxylase carboxyl transferase subunit alpha
LMRLAEKFSMPVVCFIDTPGAYPGIGAEERHVAEAIAVNIREMSALQTPIIAIVIGEGGSGGALGIGVADRVIVFENSYYSVISPEGCAAILWKDRAAAPQAAEALKLDAQELVRMRIADEVLPEPFGGAHTDHAKSAKTLEVSLKKHMADLTAMKTDALLEARYQRYRDLGEYSEG